jgi:hypothetical protein
MPLFAQTNVSAHTTGPVAVATADARTVFTDIGSGGEIVFNLPTAVAGLDFTFVCSDENGIQINASTGDTIRVGTSESVTGGLAETTTRGNVLRLVAIDATQWIAVSVVGTWTVT